MTNAFKRLLDILGALVVSVAGVWAYDAGNTLMVYAAVAALIAFALSLRIGWIRDQVSRADEDEVPAILLAGRIAAIIAVALFIFSFLI